MTFTASIILLISAITHAGWNLISKRRVPNAASFLVASIVGVLWLSPLVIIHRQILSLFPLSVWGLVCLAGLCQAVYYSSLAGAYRTGDMSIAYPLARSSPIIVVTVVSLILGRGDQVSLQCMMGIIMVVMGGLILPMKKFRDFSFNNYLNPSCFFALVAAFGTAGYSIADDEALRALRQLPDLPLRSWEISILYAFFEGVTTILWLSLFVFRQTRERKTLRNVFHSHLKAVTFMGMGISLTYTLVLISMAFVNNISYVVAFRQISIPLGVVLGVFLLKEPSYLPKYVGVSMMFIGLVLVGTG